MRTPIAVVLCVLFGILSMAVLRKINVRAHQLEQRRLITLENNKRLSADVDAQSAEIAKLRERIESPSRKPTAATVDSSSQPSKRKEPPLPMKIPSDVTDGSPTLQLLQLGYQRNLIARLYGPFFRSAGLSDDQISALKTLLLQKKEDDDDRAGAMRIQGLNPDDPTIVSMKEQAELRLLEQEKEQLGEAVTAQWKSYENTLQVRSKIGQFAGRAAVFGLPISFEQGEALSQLVTNASPSFLNGKTLDYSDIDWTKVEVGVDQILTPEQGALFKKMHQSTDKVIQKQLEAEMPGVARSTAQKSK